MEKFGNIHPRTIEIGSRAADAIRQTPRCIASSDIRVIPGIRHDMIEATNTSNGRSATIFIARNGQEGKIKVRFSTIKGKRKG